MSQHERNEWAKELIHSNLEQNELYHHGILGMHWGVRRFQPYPSDYKGDGKYVGKKMEKAANRYEKKVALERSKAYNAEQRSKAYRDEKSSKTKVYSNEYLDKKQMSGIANLASM